MLRLFLNLNLKNGLICVLSSPFPSTHFFQHFKHSEKKLSFEPKCAQKYSDRIFKKCYKAFIVWEKGQPQPQRLRAYILEILLLLVRFYAIFHNRTIPKRYLTPQKNLFKNELFSNSIVACSLETSKEFRPETGRGRNGQIVQPTLHFFPYNNRNHLQSLLKALRISFIKPAESVQEIIYKAY